MTPARAADATDTEPACACRSAETLRLPEPESCAVQAVAGTVRRLQDADSRLRSYTAECANDGGTARVRLCRRAASLTEAHAAPWITSGEVSVFLSVHPAIRPRTYGAFRRVRSTRTRRNWSVPFARWPRRLALTFGPTLMPRNILMARSTAPTAGSTLSAACRAMWRLHHTAQMRLECVHRTACVARPPLTACGGSAPWRAVLVPGLDRQCVRWHPVNALKSLSMPNSHAVFVG